MNRLNISMLGDIFADTSFALSLADECDTEKLMYCVFADGRAACRVNICFLPDLESDEEHVFIESIELTSANRTQAEKILSELVENNQRVSKILTQLDSKRYCKLTEINTYVEIDKLKAFLFNDDFSSNVNEITVCFKTSELMHSQISENGYDSISFRSIYDTVYYPQGSSVINTESIAQLHYAMQKTDVIVIVDSPFYSSFTDEQLELLKPYIKSIPVAAYNSDSDLLLDTLEDIEEFDELKEEFFENIKKVKCRNVSRLLKNINVGNAFCDDEGKMLTIGTSSGDDGTDLELHDMLIALSLNLITQKLSEWNSNVKQNEIPFSKEHISIITELADNEEQVIDFLKSDKPLIHANGGITIKNHGKYKFKESCIIAAGLYRYLDTVIDSADINETDKFHLHNKLLHNLDSYAFYDGHKLLNRELFVKAAEAIRINDNEDIIIELARNAINYLN